MLKFGSVLLSLWSALNLLPSAWILVLILFHGRDAPALSALLTQAQLSTLEPQVRATANSIAVFANGLNVAYCLLFTITIWMGLARRVRWCFWALSSSALAALLAGVGADHVVGTLFPQVNLLSGLMLAVGFALCAGPVLRQNEGRSAN